ncbi:hypothetical protein, partial [uncultured Duncaniella sp.]|uniref:hypothetical protein n=1 Tax=uncultured Duncaniella sp. TaxID=2768039 RepID=UPI00262ACBAD
TAFTDTVATSGDDSHFATEVKEIFYIFHKVLIFISYRLTEQSRKQRPIIIKTNLRKDMFIVASVS